MRYTQFLYLSIILLVGTASGIPSSETRINLESHYTNTIQERKWISNNYTVGENRLENITETGGGNYKLTYKYDDNIKNKIHTSSRIVVSEKVKKKTVSNDKIQTLLTEWNVTGRNTYLFDIDSRQVGKTSLEKMRVSMNVSRNNLTKLLLNNSNPSEGVKKYNRFYYYEGRNITASEYKSLKTELSGIPFKSLKGGSFIKPSPINLQSNPEERFTYILQPDSSGDARFKIGSHSVAVDIKTQTDWGRGQFNDTSADRDDNSGILGIGYLNGTIANDTTNHYRFDRNPSGTGGTVVDYSGNQNDGSTNGDLTTGATGIMSTTAFSFDGSDDWVDTGTDQLNTDSDFTVATWIKHDTASSADAFWGEGDGSFTGHDVWMQDDGSLRWNIQDANGDSDTIEPAAQFDDNKWHLVVTVWDESTTTGEIYLDGGLIKSESVSGIDNTEVSDATAIGARSSGTGGGVVGNYWAGDIDEVMFWDKKITADRVKELYFRGNKSNPKFEGEYNRTGVDIPSNEKPVQLEVNHSNTDAAGSKQMFFNISLSNGGIQHVKMDTNSGWTQKNYSLTDINSTGGTADVQLNITSDTTESSPLIESWKIYTEPVNSPPSVSFNPSTTSDGMTLSQSWIFNNASITDPEGSLFFANESFDGTNSTWANANVSGSGNYWENHTGLGDGQYTLWAYGNDTNGQIGKTSKRTVTLDTVAPTFKGFNVESPSTYQHGVDTNLSIIWNDATAGLNISTLEWNVTGTPENLTDVQNTSVELSAGTYYVRYYGNDTAGNVNGTAKKEFTIAKATPSLTLSRNTTLSATYPEPVKLTGSESNLGDADLSYNLYRNGSQTSNPDEPGLSAGTYGWTYNTTGGANYTSNEKTKEMKILKGGLAGTLSLNVTSPITYPDPFDLSFSESNQGDADVSYNVFRNESSDSLGEHLLGTATYGFKINSTGGVNWSTATGIDSIDLRVDKGTPSGTVSVNVTSPITYPDPVSVSTSESNQGDADLTYKLYRNDSLSSTGDFLLGTGTYGWTFNTTGGANWTSSSGLDSTELRVDKGTLTGSLNFNASSPTTYPSPLDVTFSESNQGDSDVSYSVYKNASNVGTGAIDLAATNHGFTLNSTGGANWSANSNLDSQDFKIRKAPVNVDIQFSNGNGTVFTNTNVTFDDDVTLNVTAVANITRVNQVTDTAFDLFFNATEKGTLAGDHIEYTNSSLVNNSLMYFNASWAGNANYSSASRDPYVSVEDLDSAPSIQTVEFSKHFIGATATHQLNLSLSDPDTNIKNHTAAPSGTETKFTNTTLLIDSPTSPFDWIAQLADSKSAFSPKQEVNYTATASSTCYSENATGTVNESWQIVNCTETVDVRGDVMNLDLNFTRPSMMLEEMANGAVKTATTGQHLFKAYFRVDHITTTLFPETQDNTQTSDTDTQHIYRAKQVEDNWSTGYNRLSLSDPSIAGSCQNCGKTVSINANSKTNFTYNASGDWVKESFENFTVNDSAVYFDQNYTGIKQVELQNNASYSLNNVGTKPVLPAKCNSVNNSQANLNANSGKNLSIETSCEPGTLGSPSLTSVQKSNGTRYWYNSTGVQVHTNHTKEKPFKANLSKSALTDFSLRNTSETESYFNDRIDNQTIDNQTNFVYVTVGTSFGNSSLESGSHTFSLTWFVPDSATGGSSGGSGGGGSGGGGGGGSGDSGSSGGATGGGTTTVEEQNTTVTFNNPTFQIVPGDTVTKTFEISNSLNQTETVDVLVPTDNPSCEAFKVETSLNSDAFRKQGQYRLHSAFQNGDPFTATAEVKISMPSGGKVANLTGDTNSFSCGFATEAKNGNAGTLIIEVEKGGTVAKARSLLQLDLPSLPVFSDICLNTRKTSQGKTVCSSENTTDVEIGPQAQLAAGAVLSTMALVLVLLIFGRKIVAVVSGIFRAIV